MLTVKVDGVEGILNVIDDLRDIDKDKTVKAGLKSAGNVFKVSGKAILRGRLLGASAKGGLYRSKGRAPGNLISSVTTRVKRRKPGVLVGFDVKGSHAHLVDMGTSERFYKGQSRGVMPANMFWRDNKEQNEGKASDALYSAIQKSIGRMQNRI